jgi:hypothetical protein
VKTHLNIAVGKKFRGEKHEFVISMAWNPTVFEYVIDIDLFYIVGINSSLCNAAYVIITAFFVHSFCDNGKSQMSEQLILSKSSPLNGFSFGKYLSYCFF